MDFQGILLTVSSGWWRAVMEFNLFLFCLSTEERRSPDIKVWHLLLNCRRLNLCIFLPSCTWRRYLLTMPCVGLFVQGVLETNNTARELISILLKLALSPQGRVGSGGLWTKQSMATSMGCQSGLIWVSVAGGGLPALFNRTADRFQPENVLRNQDNFPAVTYLVFSPLVFL